MGKKVAAGMSDEADDEPRRLVFYKEDIEIICKTLHAFLENAKVRCILLVDKDGHLITKEGESPTHDVNTISGLVAGSFAAIKQMAKLLGEKEFFVMVPLDKKDYIHLSLVGERTILAVIFDDKTTLGMVCVYASQVAAKLTELFKEIVNRGRKGPDRFDGVGPTPSPT